MEIVWIVILQLLGTAAIIAEVLVPSFGFLTAGALAAYGFSYYQLYLYNGEFIPILILINIISIPATLVIAVKLLSKSKLSLTENEKFSAEDDFPPLCTIGDVGEALTDLRPAGKMNFNNLIVDVLSTGNYILKGTKVSVVSIDNAGIKVVVYEEN